LFLTALFLVACATSPNGDAMSAEPEQLKPATATHTANKFSPTDTTVMYNILLAEIANNRAHNDVAAEYYFRATELSQNQQVAARATQIASFSSNPSDVLKAAKLWAKIAPDNIEVKRTLAVLYLRNKDFPAAKLQLEALLAQEPDSVVQTFLHINALLQREADIENTSEITEYLADLYPDVAEAHYMVAKLALRAEKHDTALKRIDRTLNLKPDWVEAIVLRARILRKQDKIDDAISYLDDYLNKNPNEDNLRFSYARTLIDAKKFKEAKTQFEILAVKMPNNEDILFTLAMLTMEFKEYDISEQYMNQLYNKGHKNPRILFYRGQIAERRQQNDVALERYAQIKTGDFYFEAQLRTAAILAENSNINDALSHLNTINVTEVEQKRELILFRGSLLKNFKRLDEAYDLYTRSLTEMPNDTEILFSRSLVAERLGKLDVALNDLNYIVSQEPNNAAALNALGYTLADRTTRYDEAIVFIKKALELEPDDAAIIDSLGWAQFRLGNIDEALVHLRKALKIVNDGEIAAHLGEVLWVAGNREEAKRVWQQAKEKFNDNHILIKTMERFGQ